MEAAGDVSDVIVSSCHCDGPRRRQVQQHGVCFLIWVFAMITLSLANAHLTVITNKW